MTKVEKWGAVFIAACCAVALAATVIGLGTAVIIDKVESIKYENDKWHIPIYITEIVLAVVGILIVLGICVLLMLTVVEWSNK